MFSQIDLWGRNLCLIVAFVKLVYTDAKVKWGQS